MKKTNITCTKKTRGRRRKRMGTSAATSLCKNHNNTIHESERKTNGEIEKANMDFDAREFERVFYDWMF